ncbi:protein-methionine-sulfoxide reductase heme-binding subunit MsrQ [Primorskyibacter sp. S187A]|uniref:protein-methionine-sulfoxide reductase heme-binding subunit MsrQ n=1 Tax=Primorskyibacter sp. S187A TaxID=3415130 RepID=UPI003C7CDFBA
MLVERINGVARKVPNWALYLVALAPMPWFFYLAATGQMGAEPINALERQYGEIALQLLIIGLVVTPLRRFAGINLLKFRRAIGLVAFAYVAAHLAVWLFLDVQLIGQIWADILKRPYITVGMAAFVLMIPLALTSNNLSVRKLGPTWRKLHRLTYAAALLGAVHFVMLAKGFQLEPLIYAGLVVGLLALRQVPKQKRAVA